jgi:hypothetical protein
VLLAELMLEAVAELEAIESLLVKLMKLYQVHVIP